MVLLAGCKIWHIGFIKKGVGIIKNLEQIKPTQYLSGLAITILGYFISLLNLNFSDFNLSILITLACAVIEAFIIFGSKKLKILLAPMSGHKGLILVTSISITFLITVIVGLLITIFTKNSYFGSNGNVVLLKSLHHGDELALFLLLAVAAIIFEELLMANIILPLQIYLKRFRAHWLIANLVGCIVFSLLHLQVYNYHIWPCIMVGFSRYGFSVAWRQSNSLRGGIYAHLLYDGLLLGVNLLP